MGPRKDLQGGKLAPVTQLLRVGQLTALHCSHASCYSPPQLQTSSIALLCRPRPAWTGGKTSSRLELGTLPPSPASGPSSVRTDPTPVPFPPWIPQLPLVALASRALLTSGSQTTFILLRFFFFFFLSVTCMIHFPDLS